MKGEKKKKKKRGERIPTRVKEVKQFQQKRFKRGDKIKEETKRAEPKKVGPKKNDKRVDTPGSLGHPPSSLLRRAKKGEEESTTRKEKRESNENPKINRIS